MTDNMRQAIRNQREKQRIGWEQDKDKVNKATSIATSILAALGTIALFL